MKQTGALPLALLLALPLAATPQIAPADEGPLDEITVVATRRPASTAKVSAAVSVVPSSEVAVHKLATDALASATGVSVQQTTPGQGAAIIRGLKGSSLLHLVDGMRLSNAIFRSAPTPYFALVPVNAVERLEVVRGTPASLYGSEAVGGVVQAVMRLPDFDTDTTDVRGNVALGLDTAEQQRSARGTLDAGTRRLAASLGAEYLQTGNRRVGGGQRIAPSGYESRAVRAVVRGRPDDQRDWFVDVHLLEQPATPRIDELVPGFGQTQPSSSEFLFEPNQRLFAHAQFDRKSGPFGLDWKFDAAWQRIVDDRTTRDFGATERRYEDNRSDLFGMTLIVAGERKSFDWIAGIDAYHDEVRSARREENLGDGTIAVVPARYPDGATVTQAALFGNIDWQATDRHALHGGLRFSDVGIELPDGTRIDVARFSGDAGWVFEANDVWQLVANVGIGFRAPNVFDLGTLGNRPGNRFNIPNTNLDAEHVTHVDAGVRHRSAGLQLEFVLFAIDYDNRITSVSTGDTTPQGRDIVQSVNAASSSLYGAELALALDLADNLSLRGRLNYARGDQQIGDGVEEPADRVPPLGAQIELAYDHGDDWRFEAWFATAAGQDRLSARDVADVRIDPMGTPGWGRLGARAGWNPSDAWELTLAADNLLDQRYRVHGSGIDAPGRNFSLGIRRSW